MSAGEKPESFAALSVIPSKRGNLVLADRLDVGILRVKVEPIVGR